MFASATIAPASTPASTRTLVRNASVSLGISSSSAVAVAPITTTAAAAAAVIASGSAMSPTRTTPPASSHLHSHSVPHQQVYNVNGYNLNQHHQATRSPFTHHQHNHTPLPSSSTTTRQSQFHEEGNINLATSSIHNRPSPSSSSTATTQNNVNAPTRPKMTRNNSHLRRSGPGALVIPVPPTLANSPHLQSPNSIFRRPHPGPRASPGVEEERWLRDTVPIGASGSETFVTPLSAAPVYARNASEQQGRARSSSVIAPPGYDASRANTAPPPPSPAFSLLPSSLPTRQAAYTKAHTPRASG